MHLSLSWVRAHLTVCLVHLAYGRARAFAFAHNRFGMGD
jgi:hypothetical protein